MSVMIYGSVGNFVEPMKYRHGWKRGEFGIDMKAYKNIACLWVR